MMRKEHLAQLVWYSVEGLSLLRERLTAVSVGGPQIQLIDDRIQLLNKIIHLPPYLAQQLRDTELSVSDRDPADWIALLQENLQCTCRRTISAVMITFNEERCIQRCINSIIDSVDEVVIVDTGSTDATIDIIEGYRNDKVRLFHHPWNDSFADARNYAVERATCDWVFNIDADEYLGDVTGEDFRARINLFDHFPARDALVLCPSILNHDGKTGIGIGRIFAKRSGLRFFGAVHEQIRKDPAKYGSDLCVVTIETNLHHDGYLQAVVDAKDKPTRNLTLLRKMVDLEPTNPRWKFFLARDGFYVLDPLELESMLRDTVSLCSATPSDDFNECKFFSLDLLVKLKYLQGNYREVSDLAKEMNALKPDNSNSVFYSSLVRILSCKLAMKDLLQDVIGYRENHFDVQHGMVDPGGHHIDYLIGLLLFESGRFDDARKYFDFLRDEFGGIDNLMGPYALPFIHELALKL